MKFKITLIAFLAIFSLGMNAQESKIDSVQQSSSTKYHAEIGYGQLYRYGDYIVKSPYHAIQAGFKVEFPIKSGFGIETGLKYSYVLGKREQIYAHADTAFFNYSGHLIDVPVRLTYTLPIFWGLKIFGYAGPNFNVGLSQKSEVAFTPKKTDQPNPLSYPIPGTYDLYQTELNRFAIQLGAGGGVQWKNYRLRSGYDWGVNNVGKDKNRPERIRGWHVAFEYEF